MAKEPTVQELGTVLHCIEVLRAIRKGGRTPGWYWGEVRGKEIIGTATDVLLRGGLIESTVGSQPFRFTRKGKEFLAAHIKEWETFMTTLDRPGKLEKFARALAHVSEERTKDRSKGAKS